MESNDFEVSYPVLLRFKCNVPYVKLDSVDLGIKELLGEYIGNNNIISVYELLNVIETLKNKQNQEEIAWRYNTLHISILENLLARRDLLVYPDEATDVYEYLFTSGNVLHKVYFARPGHTVEIKDESHEGYLITYYGDVLVSGSFISKENVTVHGNLTVDSGTLTVYKVIPDIDDYPVITDSTLTEGELHVTRQMKVYNSVVKTSILFAGDLISRGSIIYTD